MSKMRNRGRCLPWGSWYRCQWGLGRRTYCSGAGHQSKVGEYGLHYGDERFVGVGDLGTKDGT